MELKSIIDQAVKSDTLTSEQKNAVTEVIRLLTSGQLRVCERSSGEWTTHAWIKQAILLYFKIRPMEAIQAGSLQWYDKIPVQSFSETSNVRSVPPALVRTGAFVAPNVVLMPSFINIGAYVDSGTMVDTWTTVGSCAQVGKNVHLSGGVGLGGVLEPVQANPVIVEDNVFIGSRCIVVEGVCVKEGAVLGAGLVLTASTKIVDVRGNEPKITTGIIPERAVVIPGALPKQFPSGTYHTPCALIIGSRSASTNLKTSLNDALRDFSVSV